MTAVISSGVKTTGTGTEEVTGTGKSRALAVVAIGTVVVVGSGRVGVGGGEDMIAPKLFDTKLIWFDGICKCKWKNPLTTIMAHVVFLKLVCYPELILSIVFICMIMIAVWNYPRQPRKPPHMVTELSGSELAHPDELNEVFDSLQSSRRPDVVQVRYDRLRGIAGRVQTVVGNLATQGERAQSLLRWRDPRVTPVFMTLFLVVAIVLHLTPFRTVGMVSRQEQPALQLLQSPALQ
nr:FT-interacting protein 7-like [Aegilops tauschii subsp. strangulata]